MTFTEQRRLFHTFALPDERELKIVIAGIPHSTDPASKEELKEELESEVFTLTSISHITNKSLSPVNSLLVKLRKVGLYANIYDL